MSAKSKLKFKFLLWRSNLIQAQKFWRSLPDEEKSDIAANVNIFQNIIDLLYAQQDPQKIRSITNILDEMIPHIPYDDQVKILHDVEFRTPNKKALNLTDILQEKLSSVGQIVDDASLLQQPDNHHIDHDKAKIKVQHIAVPQEIKNMQEIIAQALRTELSACKPDNILSNIPEVAIENSATIIAQRYQDRMKCLTAESQKDFAEVAAMRSFEWLDRNIGQFRDKNNVNIADALALGVERGKSPVNKTLNLKPDAKPGFFRKLRHGSWGTKDSIFNNKKTNKYPKLPTISDAKHSLGFNKKRSVKFGMLGALFAGAAEISIEAATIGADVLASSTDALLVDTGTAGALGAGAIAGVVIAKKVVKPILGKHSARIVQEEQGAERVKKMGVNR